MGGERTFASQEEIHVEGQTDHHPVLLLHIDGPENKHIHHHTPLQQRLQRPLVRIVIILQQRPRHQDLAKQTMHRRAERPTMHRARRNQPVTIRRGGDIVRPQLAQHPHNTRREGRRQKEAGNPSERRFRDAAQRAVDVALLGLPDRLERAHVARHQGEDGDADAALHEDADYGPLQEVGVVVGAAARVGVEEDLVEGAREMGDDDGDGGETAEALGEGGGLALAFFEGGGEGEGRGWR